MKVKSSSVWIYTLIAAFGLSFAACGNSQKKREKAVQQRMAEQAMDTVTVIESETVIVIDSLIPDTTAVRKNVIAPKKTE